MAEETYQKISKGTFYTSVMPPSYKAHLAFNGYVKSVSSLNVEGNFDVLPLHENFVTMLRGPILIVDEVGKSHQINVENALLEASNNIVKVFVEF